MKLWERVVEARLRKVVEICEQQYGFMPRKSTTDAIFALRILMEKYRDGQRELHCVFVDLEKAYDRVPREELWYCMRKSGVAEKYVRVVQDMYERSRTVVRCAVGQTEEFKVEVGLHQGSALSPFLFAIVMDQLSEEVRQECPWTMMFADDIVICSESREQVEENLERWRFALERRGIKVSHSKTEYMSVNEREGSGTVRLQGEEVKKVQEFKFLGSTVQSNGESGKEVKKRVQAGWNGWRKVWGVLCERKISARIKGKVYRTVVRAAMLYGLETVSLRKRQETELEVAELKMLRFTFKQRKSMEEYQQTVRSFKLDLCLQVFLYQREDNIWKTVKKIMADEYEEQSDFLLDLFSHVKQYESKTGESVLPALLPVYRSLPADWFNVFESKQGEKEPEERWRTFLLDLCLKTALNQPQNIQQTVEKVMIYYDEDQSDFLLDLFSHVKQYESNTGRSVLPALLPVYRSLPAVRFDLIQEEKKQRWRTFLLDLCLQTALHQPQYIQQTVEKVMPDIEDYYDEYDDEEQSDFLLDLFSHVKQYESNTGESVFPALLPVYRSLPAVRFDVFDLIQEEKKQRWRTFLLDLCLQTALNQPQYIQQTVEKVKPYNTEEQSDFLLDLFSHVKQYESNTGRSVLPALLPVYRSLPAVRFNV
ncbi:hypothetical protein QTP86_018993 [Hemibagrus guttatus]|nr:hypothetical protein QTP86_018993 [Hemibagrus guttatus]